MKYLVVFLLFPLYLFGNDTLKVKARFVFSSQSSKSFQEPKFIEIEIENKTKNDCYFVKPFFGVKINEAKETPLLFLAGKLDEREDVTVYYSPNHEEVLPLRKKLRENFYAKNTNPNMHLSFYISEKADAWITQNPELNGYYFLKKDEKVTFKFFVSAKSKPGNYSLFISPEEFPDMFDQYFPDCFKGYKFFKGDFKLESPLEFRVD